MRDNGTGFNWTRVHAERNFTYGPEHVAIHIFNKGKDGQITAFVKEIVTEVVTPEEPCIYDDPALLLRMDACQILMDDLWNIGVRPSHESSIGVGKAQESHLADLRKIVFKTLEIES
jgi:hypothetical protein